ncbi:uncharacterized protein LOC143460480 [Clavelina lepadiformis]|uniref:Uncharacterized protein n=1 Tax=Clavelina lepadiformis TaxID=159417 RepID=A0ABP0GZ12_CLALP
MIGPDKELKILKQSRLMQVTEFNKMVNSLHRFKEDLAVKALTGKKNIRSQQTPDRIFFSVLEKMLLEVSSSNDYASLQLAEQQLISLRKVYLWFESNKHVLMKSDGYFKSARKITEDIYEKKNKPRLRSQPRLKESKVRNPALKTIDVHLTKLQNAKDDLDSHVRTNEGSLFTRSPTQDLTSVDSITVHDTKEFYEEDLEFAREVYDHEYMGGNKIERINRPMTAPPKLKPYNKIKNANGKSGNGEESSVVMFDIDQIPAARPQSAISQVKHEFSWAKVSPTPLSLLIRQNAKAANVSETNEKKTILVKIPSEISDQAPVTNELNEPEEITDPARIAKLVMFKEFCLEHAAQQETFMRQFTNHKHATRQHFLEFPENKTEDVVRLTASNLYQQSITSNGNKQSGKPVKSEMRAFRGMSLVDFLDQDAEKLPETINNQDKTSVCHPRLVLAHSNNNTNEPRPTSSTAQTTVGFKVPHPPHKRPQRVIQPSRDPVTVSSVFDLAAGTGRRMNAASEQALSAPKHGWRYPMVPVTSETVTPVKGERSGVVLVLQEDNVVQHKVLIPLAPPSHKKTNPQEQASDYPSENPFEQLDPLLVPQPNETRPNSSIIPPETAISIPSRASSRPMSSPRYITEVRAIYRQYKSVADGFPEPMQSNHEPRPRSLRSAGASGGYSRPRTAASWGSYPAQSEMSRQPGAASHHSIGGLRHRSVAETMRVKSVKKREVRRNSGRSSASSYVAQLRERKRTGASLPAKARPGAKRGLENDIVVSMGEDLASQPQLSFVNIVSPMHVPGGLTASAYARPGGVYCGTTAAVAIATENPTGHLVDDATSDGHLSYENYRSEEVQYKDDESTADDDKWLSQWLSGGPLDGLQGASGTGGATTYADLVSRAAILDSSDERSYSEENPSTGRPALDVASPKEDFSLSPRSDPLLSYRTIDTEDTSKEVSNYANERDEGLSRSSVASDDKSDLSFQQSSAVSSRITKSDTEDDSFIYDDYGDSSQHTTEEEDPGRVEEEKEEEKFEDSQQAEEKNNQNVKSGDSNKRFPDEKDSIDDMLSESGETTSDKQSSIDSLTDMLNEKDNQKSEPATDSALPESEDNKTDGNYMEKEIEDSSIKGENTSTKQKQYSVVEQNEKAIDMTETPVDSKESSNLNLDDSITFYENRNDKASIHEEQEVEQRSLKQSTAELVLDEYVVESEGFGSQSTTSDSFSESEGELVSEKCSVRIVITSAKKVEQELKQKKSVQISNRYQMTSLKENVNVSSRTAPSHIVSPRGEKNSGVDFDQCETKRQHKVMEDNLEKTKSEENGCLQQHHLEDDSRFNPSTHMITREEVSAVTTMLRPQSGRPIPSEAEVRDPFVDMVASTRQRQVDRNVDVQTIFRGTVVGDPYKKFDPEQRRIREKEREAVVMMQRAYRNHLARTRSARKYTGLSKETQEWARTYKQMLDERKETRKRRLHNARHSVRSARRRDAQRMKNIGPHTDVYQIYHPSPILPHSELIQESAVELQRFVRGWLIRRKWQRVRQLAFNRDSTLTDVVTEYRNLLERTQRRHGRLQPSKELTYEELEDYLHQRAKFEIIFKKREFWQEMEASELTSFFADCGLFPAQDEISEAWETVSKSLDYASKRKKRHSVTGMTLDDVLEVAFHIYVPLGARMDEKKTRLSTWLTPICNGEEGLKIINADEMDSNVEVAELELVTRLVAQSRKERKDTVNTEPGS